MQSVQPLFAYWGVILSFTALFCNYDFSNKIYRPLLIIDLPIGYIYTYIHIIYPDLFQRSGDSQG